MVDCDILFDSFLGTLTTNMDNARLNKMMGRDAQSDIKEPFEIV